ncbi:hypothetical protein C0J52_23567 [Blattella germanica]|nr:hypothetical protein C0J52_23567 [Blattella germanica]
MKIGRFLEVLKNAIEVSLGKMKKSSNRNLFDKKCEKVMEAKNETYRKMQHRSNTRGSVEIETRIFFQKLNKTRKDFQPRTTLCRNNENIILSDNYEIRHNDPEIEKLEPDIQMTIVKNSKPPREDIIQGEVEINTHFQMHIKRKILK